MRDWDRRIAAAQACIDRFSGQPFAWGKNDCLRLVALDFRKLGHRISLAKVGAYTTERGALKALAKSGHADLIAAMDAAGFARIAPASAWPGDVIAIPGAGAFGGALTVRTAGVGMEAVGFLDGEGAVLKLNAFVAAWRIA